MIQARIQGDPQSGTEGVVEATARQRKARIERSLSIVRDKRVNIAVMNGGEEAIKFSKGEILATFTPWQEGAEIMAIMEVEEKQEEEKQENEEPKALPKWGGTTKDQVEETLREAARQADMPLSKKERAELEETLLKNKEVFVRQLNKAAAATYPPHQINTGDHPPVTQRSYRMPPPMQDFIVEETKKLEKIGLVRPSQSPWSAPVVLAKKKDGTPRFCIDYRQLNTITKRDSYPLPRVDDMIDALGEARYRSTLDCASGYWQIAVNERDKEKTAFTTKAGIFEFNAMPMGLVNSQASFQRCMDMILSGLNWQRCLVYVDDIMIFSRSFQQHLQDLKKVFQRLREAGIVLRADKCHFCQAQTPYLGYLLTEKGILPDPTKIRTIQEIIPPATRKQVRSFLGLTSYY